MRKQFSKTLFFEQIFHFHNKNILINSTTFGFVQPFIQRKIYPNLQAKFFGKSQYQHRVQKNTFLFKFV